MCCRWYFYEKEKRKWEIAKPAEPVKVTMEQLHAAITSLPDKQAKRISAYYFMGMTMEAIAKSEGVGISAVSYSIQRGLQNLEKYLKKVL